MARSMKKHIVDQVSRNAIYNRKAGTSSPLQPSSSPFALHDFEAVCVEVDMNHHTFMRAQFLRQQYQNQSALCKCSSKECLVITHSFRPL